MLDNSVAQRSMLKREAPRPLKRSSSTASLPTPPRTQKRRTIKARSLATTDEISDEDSDGGLISHKRRRLTETIPEEDFDDEDAFWSGPSAKDTARKAAAHEKISAAAPRLSLSPPGSPVVPVLERARLRATSTTSSLASPPPSFRGPKPTAAKKPVVASPPPQPATILEEDEVEEVVLPSTPKKKSVFTLPIRDSPDNPFLDSPVNSDAEEADVATPPPVNRSEKPTTTFVFRGVRKEFPNPYYDHAKGRPRSPTPSSLLPLEHPDFSPDPRCVPTLLFPEAHAKRREIKREAIASKGKAKLLLPLPKSSKALSDSEAEDSETDLEDIKPVRLFTEKLGTGKGKSTEKLLPKGKAVKVASPGRSTKSASPGGSTSKLEVYEDKRAEKSTAKVAIKGNDKLTFKTSKRTVKSDGKVSRHSGKTKQLEVEADKVVATSEED